MRRLPLVALMAVAALPARGQQARHTIAPGMSRAQVIAALGEPITLRQANDFTYVFYKNSCGKQCGMNDLVVLRGDSVVDAIFRAPDRHYTGVSSSPAAIPPRVATHMKATPVPLPPPARPSPNTP